MHRKGRFIFIRQLLFRLKDDGADSLGAQISFYLILSVFPFLLFLLNIFSYAEVPITQLISEATRFLPNDVSDLINSTVSQTISAKSTFFIIFGLIFTLWSASRGIGAVRKGLNKAFDCLDDRPAWKRKGMDLLFTFGVALVMLVTALLLIFGRIIGISLFSRAGALTAFFYIWDVLRYAIPLAIMILVFSLMYSFLPNCNIGVKRAFPGAVFATLGWWITSIAFSFYVNSFGNYAYVYGSIGGVIIFLLWLYLSSIIILAGGEVNATLYYMRLGKKHEKYENIPPVFSFLPRFRKKNQKTPPKK